jgi:hypothetical protein
MFQWQDGEKVIAGVMIVGAEGWKLAGLVSQADIVYFYDALIAESAPRAP